jgi:hypothetical protein
MLHVLTSNDELGANALKSWPLSLLRRGGVQDSPQRAYRPCYEKGNVSGHFAHGRKGVAKAAGEGPAGFPQLYLLDPDRNIIEINGAA